MAYRGFVEEIPENLKRTVLGTFDFRGRSTRTELIVFFFVPQVLLSLSLTILAALFLDLDLDAQRQLQGIVSLSLMVPIPALFIRRLHDQDRSGWWVLLLAAVFVFAIVSDNGSPKIDAIAKLETAFWLDLIFVGAIIALWVLSLWPPTADTNRYGPNPRLDQAELPT